MKNLQPTAAYDAANPEFSATLVDALQPATLVQALDQGLDADRDSPSGTAISSEVAMVRRWWWWRVRPFSTTLFTEASHREELPARVSAWSTAARSGDFLFVRRSCDSTSGTNHSIAVGIQPWH
jgi:hypothetical protein